MPQSCGRPNSLPNAAPPIGPSSIISSGLARRLGCSAIKVSQGSGYPGISRLDQSVVRARNAVSHFCPGSAALSPPVKLKDKEGLYICGDWVDRTGHSSWSTEKAVVTGRQAAQACAKDLWGSAAAQAVPEVLDPPEETPALQGLRQSARLWRTLNPLAKFPRAPWAGLGERA